MLHVKWWLLWNWENKTQTRCLFLFVSLKIKYFLSKTWGGGWSQRAWKFTRCVLIVLAHLRRSVGLSLLVHRLESYHIWDCVHQSIKQCFALVERRGMNATQNFILFLMVWVVFQERQIPFIHTVTARTASPKRKMLLLGPPLWFQLAARPPEGLRQRLGPSVLQEQPTAPKSTLRTGIGITSRGAFLFQCLFAGTYPLPPVSAFIPPAGSTQQAATFPFELGISGWSLDVCMANKIRRWWDTPKFQSVWTRYIPGNILGDPVPYLLVCLQQPANKSSIPRWLLNEVGSQTVLEQCGLET